MQEMCSDSGKSKNSASKSKIKKEVTRTYEVEANDNKRKIRLLRAEYVTESGLMNEFKRIITLSE
jgi:hypothetical protein